MEAVKTVEAVPCAPCAPSTPGEAAGDGTLARAVVTTPPGTACRSRHTVSRNGVSADTRVPHPIRSFEVWPRERPQTEPETRS